MHRMTNLTRHWLIGAAMVLAVVTSAIASIYAKHESRQSFTELQVLTSERDRLEVEWGKLQIEQGTWSTYARVEQLARKQMKMRVPAPEQTMLLSRVSPANEN
jgi:cell division protein FtsL